MRYTVYAKSGDLCHVSDRHQARNMARISGGKYRRKRGLKTLLFKVWRFMQSLAEATTDIHHGVSW